MVKWEYEMIVNNCGWSDFMDRMRELGDLGWEAFSVTPDTADCYQMAFFKRIKQELSSDGNTTQA